MWICSLILNMYRITLTFAIFSPQKQCIDFAVNARPTSRYMPKNKKTIKYKIWRLVVSTKFEYFVMTLIALNTIVLMMKVRLCRPLSTCCSFVNHSSSKHAFLWSSYIVLSKMSRLMDYLISGVPFDDLDLDHFNVIGDNEAFQFYKQFFFVL